MHRIPAIFASAVVVALFGLACGGSFRTPEAVLDEQVRAFHAHLRWGRVDEASTFVAPDHRQIFLGMHDELGDDYQVTEYEIESVQVDRDTDTAVVTVWMQWFRLPSTRVDEETYVETWSYDDNDRVWRLTDRQVQE